MEYTEQELTALFDAVMVSASDIERNTPHFRDEIKLSVKLILDGRVGRRASPAPYTLDLPAALRLMREAREQGLATARDEIRKAAEREQATWDQLVRDVKVAREQGAAETLDKIKTLAKRHAGMASATAKKNATTGDKIANAHAEGAMVQAMNFVCALDELAASQGPSEYERGAAEMRERAAVRMRAFGDPAFCEVIRALPLTTTPTDTKASKLSRLQRDLSDAGDRHDSYECDRIEAEIEAVERGDQ